MSDGRTARHAAGQLVRTAKLTGGLLSFALLIGSGGGCDESSRNQTGNVGGQGGSSGAGGEGNGEPSVFLDGDLTGPLPDTLARLGLFDPVDSELLHSRATPYSPAYPLWSNGSDKSRSVVLPDGTSIDVATTPWTVPVGTLFFKTFAYDDRRIETRVIRRTDDGWSYAVYLWNDDGTDADLLESRIPTYVPVETNGVSFEHEVPSELQCRTCHESAPDPVLGFDDLRLNAPLDERGRSQLSLLHEAGVLSDVVEAPRVIAPTRDQGADVLGYFAGNCVHCHNGGSGPASAFSLEPEVAFDNLIGQESSSELVAGVLVEPGAPAQSGLILAMQRIDDDRAQPMPPVGVQQRDEEGLALLEGWVLSLEP